LGLRGEDLPEVVLLVGDVVGDEEFECEGSVVSDLAGRAEAFGGDAADDGAQQLVICVPPVEQGAPGDLGVTVRIDPFPLPIAGSDVGAVDGGAHEALMVVGGRVEHVAEDLFAGPSANAPGDVGERSGHSFQRSVEGVTRCTEVFGSPCWQAGQPCFWKSARAAST
jgi:hypothetical protein